MVIPFGFTFQGRLLCCNNDRVPIESQFSAQCTPSDSNPTPRHCKLSESKVLGLRVVHRMAEYVTDDTRLQWLLPHTVVCHCKTFNLFLILF